MDAQQDTILTVEDSPNIRRLIAYNLKRAGFAVLEAGDGKAAVRLLQKTVPDLIILDIRMPEMDGFQLLELMRKYPKAAAIPVVMMTALSQPTDVDRALALGVVDYLVKPLDPTVLIAKVKEALAHRLPSGEEWTGPNRRQFPRGSILDLDLSPLPGGKGIDVSEGGIGWRTKNPPAKDDVVVIEAPILFAELKIPAESLRARVVHTRKLGLGYHRVGASFVGLTSATRQALRNHALERQAQGALG